MKDTEKNSPDKSKQPALGPGVGIFAGLVLGVIGLAMLYSALSAGTSAPDFLETFSIGFFMGAFSFAFISPWKRLNKKVAGVAFIVMGCWVIETGNSDSLLIQGIGLIILGVFMCFDTLLLASIKKAIEAITPLAVFFGRKTWTLLKVLAALLVVFALISLVIAIGPLWIIVFLLALVVFWLFFH